MNDFFDKMGQNIADMLKTGQVGEIPLKLADGGAALSGANTGDLGNTIGQAMASIYNDNAADNNNSGSSSGIGGVLKSAFNGMGKVSTNSYSDNALGMRFYMSPPYIARQYTELGKFFSGTEPGNYYTNRYTAPMKHQPLQSTQSSDFYNRWYERMRNFAEAEEVATRGQPQVRSIVGSNR